MHRIKLQHSVYTLLHYLEKWMNYLTEVVIGDGYLETDSSY